MKIPHWKLFSWSNFFLKILAFTVFAAKILSRRSRLSRWSRAPSRLIRPRPIDWDFGPKQRVKTFPVLGFKLFQKKVLQKVHDRILIYTPKKAHSRIFVTGGSVIPWQMWAKKKTYSWGGQLVQAGRPEIRFFFGQHLSSEQWPPGHENPAMGFFWGVDRH